MHTTFYVCFSPANQIVKAVVNRHLGAAPCPSLTEIDYLVRNGNYARQKARPLDPADLDFTLQEEHIADGLLSLKQMAMTDRERDSHL